MAVPGSSGGSVGPGAGPRNWQPLESETVSTAASRPGVERLLIESPHRSIGSREGLYPRFDLGTLLGLETRFGHGIVVDVEIRLSLC